MDFIDHQQQRRIKQQEIKMAGLRRAAGSANDQAFEVAASLDKLQLATRAMWSLIREKTGLTDADLSARMHELDLADGKLDGRSEPAALLCPACTRPNNAERARCLYCEAELPSPSPL